MSGKTPLNSHGMHVKNVAELFIKLTMLDNLTTGDKMKKIQFLMALAIISSMGIDAIAKDSKVFYEMGEDHR